MSDPTDPAARPGPDHSSDEVEISLIGFLPEGVEIESQPSTAELAAAEATHEDTPSEAPQEGDGDEAPRDEGHVDLALLGAMEDDLRAVDAALTAIDDGSYGTCAVCRSPIPAELLAAEPVRRTCAEHT